MLLEEIRDAPLVLFDRKLAKMRTKALKWVCAVDIMRSLDNSIHYSTRPRNRISSKRDRGNTSVGSKWRWLHWADDLIFVWVASLDEKWTKVDSYFSSILARAHTATVSFFIFLTLSLSHSLERPRMKMKWAKRTTKCDRLLHDSTWFASGQYFSFRSNMLPPNASQTKWVRREKKKVESNEKCSLLSLLLFLSTLFSCWLSWFSAANQWKSWAHWTQKRVLFW